MTFSEDQLKEIEKFGAVFFDAEQIADILEVDRVELLKELANKKSPAGKAYLTGMMMSEYALRVSEIELAKRGSSEAIKGAKQMLLTLKLKELGE